MLSQGFNYRMKGAEASAGVISRKKTIFPKQSTFEAGNKIELLIPNIPRSFLDLKNSYLKFTIKNKTGAGACQFDNSAYCLFEKITVSSKGLILCIIFNCFSAIVRGAHHEQAKTAATLMRHLFSKSIFTE